MFGKRVVDDISNLHEWGTWESRVFTQRGARITQAHDKHTKSWGEFGDQSHRIREINLTHQLAITSTTRQKITNHST